VEQTMQDLSIPVQGMSCGGCVASVQRALSSLPGVASAVATLEPPQVAVRFEPARLGADELVQAITDAGYDVPADWNGAR
jgi:copper chaperone